MRFFSAEDLFAKGKIADVLIIASIDKAHYAQAVKALELEYDLLLEKPISPSEKECLEIGRAAEKHKRKVVVCHVMRYTAYYQKLKQLLSSGVIGRVIAVNQIEKRKLVAPGARVRKGQFQKQRAYFADDTAKMLPRYGFAALDCGRPPRESFFYGQAKLLQGGKRARRSSDRCVTCKYR